METKYANKKPLFKRLFVEKNYSVGRVFPESPVLVSVVDVVASPDAEVSVPDVSVT
jgi:hypothetical protein